MASGAAGPGLPNSDCAHDHEHEMREDEGPRAVAEVTQA